jgi:hypothetical protein
MPGFNTLDDIAYANSVLGRGQRWPFHKALQSYTSGKMYSLWPTSGSPGAGGFPGVGLTATAYSAADPGAMFFNNPSGGRQNFITAFQAFLSSAVEGDLHIVDRLLSYGGIAVNTAVDQAMTNVTAIPRYATGYGNRVIVEVQTLLGAGSGNFRVYYTNESGVINRVDTAGLALDSAASASPCRIPFTGNYYALMQASDRGITKIDKVNFVSTTFASGALCASIVQPLASIPLVKGIDPDMVMQAIHGLQVVDGACLMFLFQPYTTTSIGISGIVRTTEN